MEFRKQLPPIIAVIFFLFLNLFYIFIDVPKLLYPSTAFLFLFGLILASWRKQEQDEKKIIEQVELTLTKTVPRERLLNELEMAKRVQEGLLSVESPEVPGIRIAKKCVSAESVGGDFYSFISKDFVSLSPKEKKPGIVEYFDQQDTYLAIAIGDVAGHGVSSALIMALASGLLSEIGKQSTSPAKTLAQTNDDLVRYIENSQITHVTAFYSVLNTSTKKFVYSRAGHPPAILIRKDGSLEELDTEGVFLGMFSQERFEEKSVVLQHGDRVLFYTDGITETKGPNGEIFGVDRLKLFLESTHGHPVGNIVHLLFEELDRYSNYQKAKDDRSVVILEIE